MTEPEQRKVDGPDRVAVLRITPQPTDEELAAIVSVTLALDLDGPDPGSDAQPPEDRWRIAGRREALRTPLDQPCQEGGAP